MISRFSSKLQQLRVTTIAGKSYFKNPKYFANVIVGVYICTLTVRVNTCIYMYMYMLVCINIMYMYTIYMYMYVHVPLYIWSTESALSQLEMLFWAPGIPEIFSSGINPLNIPFQKPSFRLRFYLILPHPFNSLGSIATIY